MGTQDSERLFMEELKNEFFENVKENLKKLPEFYENKNFIEIKKIAHNIKGTAGIFEMVKGSEIGKELQAAADTKDEIRVKVLIDELIKYMVSEGVEI